MWILFSTPALATAPGAPDVRLVAVGDILPHRRVKASARIFGWDASFSAVAASVQAADLAFANLESPVAPDHHKGIHGEVFNAPASLVDGLATAGFDVLSMANNHVWDQGVDGMLETRDRVKAAGMVPIGVGSTCAEATAPVVQTVNGVRIGLIAMVDLLNADLRTNADQPCVFVPGPLCTADCTPDRDALFFRADPAVLASAVQRTRAVSDVVVVSFHWGNEYRTSPLAEYRAMAATLVGSGADLVLGHHPHVLQPIERIEHGGRSGIVAYSLGNFLSDMGRSYTPNAHPIRKGNTRDGVILTIDIHRTQDGFTLTPSVTPTWTMHTLEETGERIEVVPLANVPTPLRTLRAPHVTTILGPTAKLTQQVTPPKGYTGVSQEPR